MKALKRNKIQTDILLFTSELNFGSPSCRRLPNKWEHVFES